MRDSRPVSGATRWQWTLLSTDFLTQRARWAVTVDPATARTVAAEVEAAGAYLVDHVTAYAHAHGAMSAEVFAHDYDALLAHGEIARWRTELHTRLTAAGQASCEALATRATSPYLTWAVADYCAHWGDHHVAVPPLPDLHTKLVIDGSAIGESDQEFASLRGALETVFRTSVWYAPNATTDTHATLGGGIATERRPNLVTRTQEWSEQIPYTAYETVNIAYREPYEDTETYTVKNPDSNSEETRTRTVIRYRVGYRPVSNEVTRYREEPHIFTYQVNDTTVYYAGTLGLQLGPELGG